MTERPIIMSAPMVKAILDLKKSQTRRIIKLPPSSKDMGWDFKRLNIGNNALFWPADIETDGIYKLVKCPYGQVGDRLWVRETHYRYGHWNKNGLTKTGRQKWTFKATTKEVRFQQPSAGYATKKEAIGWFKRPSIFMPRWASRIDLEITGVRVERLQEITEKDCIAEGIDPPYCKFGNSFQYWSGKRYVSDEKAQNVFRDLWDKLNAKRGYGWEANPWCWIIEFKMVTK